MTRASGARHRGLRRGLGLFVFLALAQWFASLLATALHEVVGHGLMAEVLGGDFVLFYLSPLRGWAYTVEAAGADDVVRAGGVLAGFAAGLPAMLWLRRTAVAGGRVVALRTLVWFFVVATVVGGLGYMSGEPMMRWLTGGDATGDWDRIYLGLGVPLPIPFVVFGVACAWAMALMMDEARAIVHALRADRPATPGPLRAFWSLWAPGLVLTGLYAAATWAWLSSSERGGLLGEVLVPVLVGLAGWAWLRLGIPVGMSRPPAAPLAEVGAGTRWYAWSAALSVPVVAVLLVFGPVESNQRGVLIGRPDADRYDLVAQSLDLGASVRPDGSMVLDFTSLPRRGVGPPLRRRLTDDLAGRGPSLAAATAVTRFVATWNLDGAAVVEVNDVGPVGQAWSWKAVVEPTSDSIMIRLWPLTMFQESHVRSFELSGATRAESFTARAAVGAGGGSLAWSRGEGFEGIDSAAVWLP